MSKTDAIVLNTIRRVPLAAIDKSGRLRPVDPAKVQLIADSILAWRATGNDGIPAPITVRPTGANQFKLVAGGHRIDAAELLGDTEIDCIVRAMGDLQARLMEIDENLCRNELNALDRAAFLAERDRIWREMYPEKTGGKGRAKARWHSAGDDSEKFSLSSEISERIGLSQRAVQADVKLYRLLSSTPDAIERIRGTWLEGNQSQLKAFAAVPPSDRGAVLDRILREDAPAKNVAGAVAQMQGKREPSASPDELLFKALVNTWTRAGAKVRGRFLDHLHAMGTLDAYTNGTED